MIFTLMAHIFCMIYRKLVITSINQRTNSVDISYLQNIPEFISLTILIKYARVHPKRVDWIG